MILRFLVLLFAACHFSVALADEASVKRAVEAKFSGVKVDSVTKTPYAGLYEVVVGDTIFYADEKVDYLFRGDIIEARSDRNLTEERQRKLSAIKFEDLPLDIAIKQVRGNGKRVVAIFADPFCPYCRSLDRSLLHEDNITIYTFLYPILRPESPDKARQIWCAPDRAKAYYDFMLSGREPAVTVSCNAPVDKWLALGQKVGVRATPTSFALSGERILGAQADEVVKLISQPAK
jgi:thiol:disulfide interchange protein DsbC